MRRRVKKRQSGIALLMVLIALLILGSMTADLMQTNDVYLATTRNSRDSARAEYLSRSGINLARLVLSFQRIMGPQMNFPFWQYADMLISLFASPSNGNLVSDMAGIDLSGVEGIGLGLGESDDLAVTIIDEDSKLNVNMANHQGRAKRRVQMYQALLAMTAPEAYDPLFDREAPNGQIFDREEMIGEILDYTDGDENLYNMMGSEDPSVYQTLDPPYERKNAPFDSLEELHMVAGIGDDFWSAFVEPDPEDPTKRTMTVWGTGAINVNTAPTNVLFPAICMLATDDSGVNPCLDPVQFMNLAQFLQVATFIRTLMPFKSDRQFLDAIREPQGWLPMLTMPGFPLQRLRMGNRAFKTASSVFSIYSEGTVGNVTRRIHAVVDMKSHDLLNPKLQMEAAGGKILYWRME